MADKKPSERLIRVTSIVGKGGILPISKATWYAGVRSGRYPQPTPKISPNVTTWRLSDVEALVQNGYSKGVK